MPTLVWDANAFKINQLIFITKYTWVSFLSKTAS